MTRTDPSISQYGSDSSSIFFYQVRHVAICPSHLRRCASRLKTDDGKFPFAAEHRRHVSVNGQRSDRVSMSGGTLRAAIRSDPGSVSGDEEPIATCSLLVPLQSCLGSRLCHPGRGRLVEAY